MKLLDFLLIIIALGVDLRAQAGTSWAYVPASMKARLAAPIAVTQVPEESVVTFAGTSSLIPADVRKTFGFGLPAQKEKSVAGGAATASATVEIPNGAHWPDADGRIISGSQNRGTSLEVPEIRNPWEVRIQTRPLGGEALFTCGGIIAGGEGGSVAILNGHIVARGDSAGKFYVAGVLPNGVLLERGGAFFVLPLGMRTTIAAVDE